MKKRNRYAKASTARRWSGTGMARKRKQVIAALVCLVLCAFAGIAAFRGMAKTEKKTIVLPTPTPTEAPSDPEGKEAELASPYRMYTERYTTDLSPDNTWMEDFDDTRIKRNVKGIYLTADVLNKKLDEILAFADSTGINAVVIDFKGDDGSLTAKVTSRLLREKGSTDRTTLNDLSGSLAKFKAHNIYCIARIVCFRDNRTVSRTPSYGVRLADGTAMKDKNGYTWLNPFLPEVWEFLTEVGREAAKMGFDEINFDYCGFPTDAGAKNGRYGKDLTRENKEEAVTGFLKYACENLRPLGVFVSADVGGTIINSDTDASAAGQNYAELCLYLDYICPMVYPSSYSNGYYSLKIPDAQPYELVLHAMKDSKQALSLNMAKGRCAEVRPWLQAFTATWLKGHIEYGSKALGEQIRATYDAGYSGWLLWNQNGAYEVFRDALGR